MRIEPFQAADAANVRRLHEITFADMSHRALEWQPCEQVESLDRSGVKVVARAPQLIGYGAPRIRWTRHIFGSTCWSARSTYAKALVRNC